VNRRLEIIPAAVAFTIMWVAAVAETKPSATLVLEADTITQTNAGKSQPIHVAVETWDLLSSREGAEQEIPLSGFYVAHLLSGQISSSVDGKRVERKPGDYWTVAAGTRMHVKVLREFAVLETIVPTSR
jgi:quercetin dioxygenase-like cupin family protein